jgi:hypothetical protein
MKLRNKVAALCAAGLLALSTIATATPKTLIVGIDGAQYEKMRALNLPTFSRLYSTVAYTGGVYGSSSQQDTLSGPGWATILTGVWANKHKITSNGSGLADANFPSIFKRVRDASPNAYIASVASWSPINDSFFAKDIARNNLNVTGKSDAETINTTLHVLQSTPADLVFVHLSDPDNVAHVHCFGTAYNQALATADRQLGQLLDAVGKRAASGDDWLVLVTTDHGRQPPSGCNHGGQTTMEKNIFVASNQPLNAEFSEYVRVANQDFDGIYGFAAQTSITPTVLRHMGIEPQPDWLLDGIPLNGQLGVRKLMGASSTIGDLSWSSTDAGTVTISRGGKTIASVPARDGHWRDPAPLNGINDYTLTLNNTPVSIRQVKREVLMATDWSQDRSYIFLTDGDYAKYDQKNDRVANGYPLPVSHSTWCGLAPYANHLVAGFSASSSIAYFFLDNGTYLRYDKVRDCVASGYPMNVAGMWPGLGVYARDIRTAVRWSGDKVFFILKNGQYIRYDLKQDRMDSGYPQAITDSTWPGVGRYANDIIGALKWDDTRAYLFLTGNRYIRYSITNDRAESGPLPMSYWPGLLTN